MIATRRALARAAVTTLLLAVPPGAARAAQGGAAPTLDGARYETLRSLARHLDETAQGLLEGAGDAVLSGEQTDARFLSSIRAFARSARDFRAAVEGYPAARVDLAPRVAALAEVSSAVEERLRAAGVLPSTYPEWAAVGEVVELMRVSLSGGEVKVPPPYVVPALTGAPLQRFRDLAADLDGSAAKAYGRARDEVGSYRSRGEQFLGELHYFAAVSRDLRARADAGSVSPKSVGPIVDDLLREAREADGRMREANVFKEVWEDSSRTIAILQQMVALVRS
ncbi:MAG TPA: hypothetical protein VFQ51_16755 [Vicinamibacteria bacterium]|nr:hypothetical protein [Vicinamibacteria bacterium]